MQEQQQYQQQQQQYQLPQQQVYAGAVQQGVYIHAATANSKQKSGEYRSFLIFCFGSLALSYVFAFICEQLSKNEATGGIVLGVMAMILSFPVPIVMFYPILNDTDVAGRREHFAMRVCIAILLYVIALIMSIVTVVQAINDILTVPGVIVTSAGLLVMSSMVLYLDHPQNKHTKQQVLQAPQQQV